MKHTRLLEIIREEIAGALNEKKGNVELPSGTPTSAAQQYINKGIDISFVDKNGKTTFKEAQLEGEKRKKLAEKYQLDEETINEMASVVQTRQALEALEKAGIPNSTERLELVKDVEKETLDQFKNSNPSMTSDGRLARKLEPEEITGKRDTRGYGADFERNFEKKAGMDFLDFTITIQKEIETNKIPLSREFNAGLATNTTEKDAAAQVFGLEKRTPGPQADPNKPKKEKPASTGKKGRPASEPKTEKTATLTKGDDGFDTVEYSDVEVDDKEATQNIGSDPTAQKLGKVAYSKNLTPEEETQYKTARDGINAKIKRIEDGEEKPNDRALLQRAYQNSEIQRLYKAKGLSLDDILKGIIG
jgi:hypothetical protein